MKEKKLNLKSIFYLITLLSIVILCNLSVVQADSNPPAECRLSINNNALYTNNRYVTIDLYATDADPMQVWISNDGNTGTVVDFSYGKTITITDQNYSIGVAFTSSNSTTSTNSDNVLRIVNWPLSSVNGTKKVYAVFRDSYGNKTSVSGLTTITITYNLNGVTGTTPTAATTVKNLGVYIPTIISSVLNKSFKGWSTNSAATLPSYTGGNLASFSANTTLYAIYGTITAGDYVYYPIDLTQSYEALSSLTGTTTKTYATSTIGSNPVFRVLSASSTTIILCPDDKNEVFSLSLGGSTAYFGGQSAIAGICGLYTTNYSNSITPVTPAQMQTHKTTNGLSSFFQNNSWAITGWGKGHAGGNESATMVETHLTYANITSSTVIEVQTFNHYASASYTYSYYVIPAITLKSAVRFSGIGTIDSPYTLIIQ